MAWVVLFERGFGPSYFRGLLFPRMFPTASTVFSCSVNRRNHIDMFLKKCNQQK